MRSEFGKLGYNVGCPKLAESPLKPHEVNSQPEMLLN